MKEKKMTTAYLIKRFLPYYKKYKWTLVLDLLCAALTTVCELIFPMIIRRVTFLAENDIASLTFDFIGKIALLYIVLRIIDTMANYFMANTGHVMGTRMETDMRHDLFEHLQTLSYSYYTDTKVGQIMARITSDLFDITEFAHHCPEEFFITGIKVLVSFIILININIPLTLIIFLILPVMLVCSLKFRKKMRLAFSESRKQTGEINAQVEDSLLGIRVVKSFANEAIEQEKFDKGNLKFLNIKQFAYKYMAGFHTTTRFFDGVMHLAVVVAGAIFIITGKIDASDLIAYLLYVTTLIASIRTLMQFTEQFQKGMTGIERFLEIMDTEAEIVEKDDTKEFKTGDIAFENVTFRYDEEDKNVITNLNMTIKTGNSVALVGPSGGGKTTLCNLIPRFYDVSSGRITIDGVDICDMSLKSLRSNIGVVQQDVYLFSGTIFENIAYGKPGATMEEVVASAKDAGADEFIKSLPDGYNSYVGERGIKLSGGQKQRISIARVFLKNPPILILDEATSSLDNESEKIVQKSLERLAKGRTVFTIAHRLTTIKNADTILVLTKNGIEEQGTHEELLEKDGIYAYLYKM
ncbi:MAG: ABC transporter ATP-binding protein [Clostridia bacterium]|nr:ABC transporter ATP-binding protein [Clostridia bacterium]